MIVVDDVVMATVLAIVAGLLRSVFGWAENALRDGKIEDYEWRQLAGTIAAYIGGINAMSIGLEPEIATVVVIILDMLRTGLRDVAVE